MSGRISRRVETEKLEEVYMQLKTIVSRISRRVETFKIPPQVSTADICRISRRVETGIKLIEHFAPDPNVV